MPFRPRRRAGPPILLARAKISIRDFVGPAGLEIGCLLNGVGRQQRSRMPADASNHSEFALLIWRRRRDSNPRYGFRPYNGLANRRLQPLGHVSVDGEDYRTGAFGSNHPDKSRQLCAQLAFSQARAERWASAISMSDICPAISWRSRTASLLPCKAAMLNHLCALT